MAADDFPAKTVVMELAAAPTATDAAHRRRDALRRGSPFSSDRDGEARAMRLVCDGPVDASEKIGILRRLPKRGLSRGERRLGMAEQAQGETFVGRPMERVEDAILLTGRARFSDHLPTRTDTLHAAILRSPHAHAEIVAIDTSKAEAMPGVAAVLTGDDLAAMSKAFLIVIKQPMQHYAVAVGKVRYVGEPVAVVVASDRYRAEDALEHIDVTWRVLDAVVDPEAAAEDGAPLL
jgi:hypothetical protein